MLQARAGIGRSGYMRSGVFDYRLVVSINDTDRTSSVLDGTVRIHKALGDMPATASFGIKPDPGFTITAGQTVIIGLGSTDNPEFAGQVDRMTHERLFDGTLGSFIRLSCVDYRRLFDRLVVNREWNFMSATAIAYDIVGEYTTLFSAGGVQPGLAMIPRFVAENAAPSELLRQLSGLIGGGFYIDAFRNVHLFSGIGETWRQSAPQAITIANTDLLDFRHERDFSQLRTRVICEGKRTRLMLALPEGYNHQGAWNFVPIEDATGFEMSGQTVRIGPQRFTVLEMYKTAALPGENAAGTSVRTAAAVGATSLAVDSVQFLLDQLQANGGPNPAIATQFVKVGEQVIRHTGYSYVGSPSTTAQLIGIPASGFGSISTPIEVDAQVTPLATLNIYAQRNLQNIPVGAPVVLYAQADNTSAQSALAAVEGGDGIHEHVISESALDYTGALARAEAELDAFDDTDGILSAEWISRDLNTRVGIYQDIAMQAPDALSTALTVTDLELEFPVSNAKPIRRVRGSTVRTAKLLDVVQIGRK